MKRIIPLFILLLISLFLSSCAKSETGAADTVHKYFQAIVDSDENRIATLSCPDWESSARADVAAFDGVKARLENVSCKLISENGSESVVECSGSIIATYNNEDSTFNLQGKQMKVVNQNGEWLVCGYAQ